MKILEQYIMGKTHNQNECEDGLLITPNLIAVVDGVTTKSSKLWDGSKSGLVAKNIILDALKCLNLNQPAYNFFFDLNTKYKQLINHTGFSFSPEDVPKASIILYNNIRHEIWNYGDCQCIINNNLYTHEKEIDYLNASLRSMYIYYLLSTGETVDNLLIHDISRDFIKKNLECQYVFENKCVPYGYPVVNGDIIEKSMISTYKIPSDSTIILASDGYPYLKKNLFESERELSVILQTDPLCYSLYKSTKGLQKGNNSFDDRVYCRFIV